MYPQQELNRLAAQKTVLRRSIEVHRAQCAVAAARLVRPLAWLDKVRAFCRRISPLAALAAVPVGFMVARTVFPRLKFIGSLLRWGPLVAAAVRGVRTATEPRAKPVRSATNGR